MNRMILKRRNSILMIALCMWLVGHSQDQSEIEGVKSACMGYFDGFYQGDTTLLKKYLQPSLNKFGFWKDKEGKYGEQGYMTFGEAVAYAREIKETQQFPSPDAPKKVEILDIMNHIAAAKITGWWGQDYLLLSKKEDHWIIHQVLWEGPLEGQ